MSDSVDRVFIHALHTVKKIPRMGSARPPIASRLRLYGLYKQSMEGDVEGVLDRPRGDGEEIRSDQEKWDAWNYQKGLSRTEAKRQYISTLIETMHRYASQTTDTRELVSELEFVWDQIKSNSLSNSSSTSYPNGISPTSNRDQPIYPVMSEQGAQNPGYRSGQPLQRLDPISQNSDDSNGEDEDPEAEVGEEFVDAQDSQIADGDARQTEETTANPQTRPVARGFGADAGAILAPIANYWRSRRMGANAPRDANSEWQRRVESALIKMNAEIAALREQLETQHQAATHSSILRPFSDRRRHHGFFAWLVGTIVSFGGAIVKHMIIDAILISSITIFMHYRGIPFEKLEQIIFRYIDGFRQLALLRRIERRARRTNIQLPVAVQRTLAMASNTPRDG